MEEFYYAQITVIYSDYKLQNLVKSLDFLTEKKNAKIIRKKALKYAKKNLDINLNINNILKFYRNVNKVNW